MGILKNLKGKNFINLEDFTKDELLGLLDFAAKLKKKTKGKKNLDILKNKNLVMYFSKPSLRTRLSFEIGMKKLGGETSVIKQDEIILGKRESIEDTARVISKYADGVTIRTFAHNDVELFAKYSSIPVVNALTDLSHPCKIMADLLTLKETFNTLKGLKIAYVGDGNNVVNSLMTACSILGIDISVATPLGYEPDKNVSDIAKKIAQKSGSHIEILQDPIEAAKGVNAFYTDVWTSMGQEAEYEKRKEIFKNYQINEELMKHTNKNAIILHCLPAHKGEEITKDVFEKYQKAIFDEAENRMYAQMAILATIMK